MSKPYLKLVKTEVGPELGNLRAYKWVFLSSPYTAHKSADLDQAHHDVSWLLGKLKAQELFNIYSPIAHWHNAASIHSFPTDHEAWARENEYKLGNCCAVLVAKIDGWENSEGIKWELQLARNLRKPIYYLDPITMAVTQ